MKKDALKKALNRLSAAARHPLALERVTLEIGVETEDGIYFGRYKPKDRDGNSLGKIFNLFAAREDLPEPMTYLETVHHIASMENGTNYATDKELYAAIRDGSYKGGWVIPPRDILDGTSVRGGAGVADNLMKHRDQGALKGTFKTGDYDGTFSPDWYWSSTPPLRQDLTGMWAIRLQDGDSSISNKSHFYSCRPVRLLEVNS